MRISNLEKRISGFHLNIHELNIKEGCIHGFIGANGCGKTTLAKILMGIHFADKGEIDFGNLSMDEITMTSQRPYLLHSTVYENLIYPIKIRKKKLDKKRVDQLLEVCGLLDKKKQYARSLSSGERQKLSLIRSMIFEPKLIIIDETLSNLDLESVKLFEEMILMQQKKEPITWILISHQLAHIHKMCDYVHFFSNGKLISSGSADEILIESKDEKIKSYLKTQIIETRK